jgi:hypothetical protein
MMAPALVDNSDVPSDVRDYFAAVRLLAGQQAEVLLALSAEIVSALHAIGARPVLLKGAAALAQGLYPSRDLRLMTDVDVLIAPPKIKESIAALASLGYRDRRPRPIVRDFPTEGIQAASSERYHVGLVHRPTGIRVEVHHALSVPRFAALLSAQDALDRAISISANKKMFSVLAPTDRIVHHVLHAQLHHPYLHHQGVQYAVVDLRQLVDLAVLADVFGGDIDWADVESRFSSNGYENVLADYLAYLALLLDRRVPAHTSELAAITARLRAGVGAPPEVEPRDTIGAIASEYWKRFRRRPALAINLINPRPWPDRLRSWRQRLRPD